MAERVPSCIQMALPGICFAGFASCPYHQRALAAVREFLGPERAERAARTFPTRAAYRAWLLDDAHALGRLARACDHTSSPLVWQQHGNGDDDDNGIEIMGGCDHLLAHLASTHYTCRCEDFLLDQVRAYCFKGIPCRLQRHRDNAGYEQVARIPLCPLRSPMAQVRKTRPRSWRCSTARLR